MKKNIALLIMLSCLGMLFTGCDKKSQGLEQLIIVRDTETGATATLGDGREAIDKIFDLTGNGVASDVYSERLFVTYVDDIAMCFQSYKNTRFELVGYDYFDFDAEECKYTDGAWFGGDGFYSLSLDEEFNPVIVSSSSDAQYWICLAFQDDEFCGFYIVDYTLGAG